MENLLLSADVVLPLFLLMSAGYLLKRLGLYDDASLKVMNNLVFRVFLPVLIFKNIFTTSLGEAVNGKLFLYAATAVPILFLLLFLLVPRFEKNGPRCASLIQGIGRSNFVLFGIPLAVSLYGEGNVGSTSLLIAVVIPLFNVLSVIALVVYGGGKADMGKIVRGILTNPLILASLLGLACMAVGLRIPSPVMSAVEDLSKIATPLALFLLGGSFEFSKVRQNRVQLFWGVMGRLVIAPAVFVSLAALLGFRGLDLASLMIVFAAPTAVNSYVMAQQMGGDADLAGQQVVFSSAFAIPSIFLWIFILKQMALI